MASKSQAGFGSRLQNSKDLLTFVKTLTKYTPIIDEIKLTNYEPFINSVVDAMTPYNTSHTNLKNSQNIADSVENRVRERARKVRNVLLEIYGKSETYDDYNELIDVITGDNVRKNSYRRSKEEEPAPPEGTSGTETPEEEFQSVSQQDRGSILAKFISLIDALTGDVKYTPTEPELQITGLTALSAEFSAALTDLGLKIAQFEGQRSIILPMFDGPGSLHERAERAKVHVKRQYGPNSIEFKTLTGKEY